MKSQKKYKVRYEVNLGLNFAVAEYVVDAWSAPEAKAIAEKLIWSGYDKSYFINAEPVS